MSDWPAQTFALPPGNLSTAGACTMCALPSIFGGLGTTPAAWPSANRAIYVAIVVPSPVTIVKMAFQVGTQSGNFDIGIYDEHAHRIVSTGSTGVPATGIGTADIADTPLSPGVYFLAMCVDNTTATFLRYTTPVVGMLRAYGVQQQAVGAVTLPDPATFANPASTYIPVITAMTVATI